tara:strand:+ start:177 stop:878 length:702 start_codon:yes stop_codon:yes gene_type:complete
MTDQDLFRTFFFISKKEISICVRNNNDFKNIFFKKKELFKDKSYFDDDDIESFFFENIEKIENQIKIFIKNISLIIEDDNIFSIEISLKQKIENRAISQEEFKNLLLIGLEQVNKYNPNLSIIHYIAEVLRIDDQIVESIENKKIKSHLCVDLKFICIDQKFVTKFKDLFKKKHVFLEKIFSGEYLRKYNAPDDDIINCLVKIEEGLNKLEVKLIPKKPPKKGFFEKFFSYFS